MKRVGMDDFQGVDAHWERDKLGATWRASDMLFMQSIPFREEKLWSLPCECMKVCAK